MRRYYRHRRAYAPRMWPSVGLACALAVGLDRAFGWSSLVAGVAGGLIGFAVMQLRWTIWRRRHPVITHDQYIEDMRRAARWN